VASLVYIVSEIKATNFENFQAILNLALATATVLAAGTVPRENVSVDLAVSALDALSTLHTQVRDCIVDVLDVVCETAIAYLFFSLSTFHCPHYASLPHVRHNRCYLWQHCMPSLRWICSCGMRHGNLCYRPLPASAPLLIAWFANQVNA